MIKNIKDGFVDKQLIPYSSELATCLQKFK